MEIREILPWDKPHFCRMVGEFYALPAVAHPIPPAHAERTFALLLGDTPYARCFIAADERDIPHAYCLCAVTWSNEAGGLCVWIEEIYVEDSLRGQGVGQKLIAAVQAAYPNAARFRLEVTDKNPRAAALYRGLGFEGLPYRQMVMDFPG
ncbi:MAG: GNAT family N-acetyltransferase [Eubacteriales bacterium]|nr:GNAT family N-acetyltransferase [Eubacteriales bacterium]